jgi:YihY family inner membrane protein
MTGRIRRAHDALDRGQQRHAVVGLPFAVVQKYLDDQGGYLAATITYYGFLSIFPSLLVVTTVVGYVLRGHRQLSQRLADSAFAQFPVVGHDLRIGALHGSGVALAIGLVGATWAGSGFFLACENAMNQLWGVPFRRRPDVVRARLRALALLALLGGGLLATTILTAATSAGLDYGAPWKAITIALSTLLNFAFIWVGFRALTAGEATWRQLRGGALGAALMYLGLQALGGYFIAHVVRHAGDTYGVFALVIGLMTWIYASVTVTLLAAEANVVATRRLWPRSLSLVVEQPPTGADKRALTQRGKVEERRQDQDVSVDFHEASDHTSAPPDTPESAP